MNLKTHLLLHLSFENMYFTLSRRHCQLRKKYDSGILGGPSGLVGFIGDGLLVQVRPGVGGVFPLLVHTI